MIYQLIRSTLKFGRWLNEPITTAHYPIRRLLALCALQSLFKAIKRFTIHREPFVIDILREFASIPFS